MSFNNLIDGSWQAPTAILENVNPSDTADVIGEFAAASVAQAEQAVGAAHAAAPGWAATTGARRFEILDAAGDELLRRRDELGDLLAREEGKTLREAVGEVARAGQLMKYHGAQAVRTGGGHYDSTRPGVYIDTVREPVGVVSLITPWNFPIAIPAWKLAPALAYGNTVVFKPAELVPASAWHLVDILHRAGLPPGALNLVMGRGTEIGDVLTGSPDVNAISFTGSTATGARVLANAQIHQTRVQLEMGGKNPLIVADDADLQIAVEVALEGSFGSTGQRCTASSRVIVMAAVYDEFLDRLIKAMRALTVGDARADGVDVGPVVDERQLTQDERYLALAADEGAEVIGGERRELTDPGFYLSPALLLGTTNDDTVNREEIFGPIASLIRADDYDQAVAIANDTEFGLAAGMVTTSLARAADFQRRSTAGMVMINLPTAGVDIHVPFGGRRASSYGPREQGEAAIEFYTAIKTAYIRP